MNSSKTGILYVVATPIGNRGDWSTRAIETLKMVDRIAGEDTRHSRPLLQHFAITTPVFAFHEHNEKKLVASLVRALLGGENLALVSDAGTPLISDPGYRLVSAAHDAGIRVSPIPGACAAVAALSAAGLATDRFTFEGFLPSKPAACKKRLDELRQEPQTLIFYESPQRIKETVAQMLDIFGGDRAAVIAREISKKFETIKRGSLAELKEWIKLDENQQRGEIVLLVAGKIGQASRSMPDGKKLMRVLLQKLSSKDAAKIAAEITGGNKNEFYSLALKIAQEGKV